MSKSQKTTVAAVVETTTQVAVINWSFIATQVAENALGYKGATEQADSFMAKANELAQQMIKAKVKIGSRAGKNPCSIAVSFVDRLTRDYVVDGKLVCKGLAEKTATQVYLPAFKDAVNNGKKLEKWNIYRDSKPADTKKGGAKGKGKSTMSNLLVKAFNHDDGKSFEALCEKIEKQWDNAEFDSIYQCFIDYLKSEGFEIKE
ncbi:MAG: hypothetical protein EBQ97_03520 [Bacteroidetes bacterium]|nr:hypothetical protein [Bacteroidota bacterium]